MKIFAAAVLMLACAYGALLLFARLFAERIIFPAPPASYSDGGDIIYLGLPGGGRAAALWIPAGCDIYAGGWPFAHLIGKTRPEGLRRTLPYYDAGSFATRIKDIPVMFSMGLIDEVCKADGVSAVYNRLATPLKRRVLHERMQHETGSSVILELTRFIMGNLK